MFQKELVARGIDWVMNYYPYENPVPYNTNKMEKMLISHIKRGSRIGIFPDSDIDGLFSALIIKSLLELLGCKDIYIVKIMEKSHGINSLFVDQVVDNNVDLLITVDSSTNNRNAIEKLSSFNIDHIIIDHHIVTEDITTYPENVIVINSKDKVNSGFSNVSAGMLCYIVAHNLLNKVKIDTNQRNQFLYKMYVLGYITLYTDCMNLADEYNLSVIQNIELRRNFTPKFITVFMSDYDYLCRNFIEYRLGPRLNSVIRRERFDIIYDLLFKRHSTEEYSTLVNTIEQCYIDSKDAVNLIAERIEVDKHTTFVCANLDTMKFNNDLNDIMKNYTGLIASRLTERYGRLAIVVATDKVESFKGSVRDPYNRKSLDIFKRICDCGGHMSAFGFHLLKKNYKSFVKQLDILSPVFKEGMTEAQIVLDGEEFDDRLAYKLRSIAEYNEVSGNVLPKAVIKKRIGHSQKVRREEKYSKVKWENVDIVSFNNVYIGDTLIITPTLSKNDVICYGKTVTSEDMKTCG